MNITRITNYAPCPGMIGSVNHHAFISEGIEYLTRWWREHDAPPVSHSLVASNAVGCVEANADGVDSDPLSIYNDPAYALYWRIPWFWTPEIGLDIAAAAAKYIGYKYNFGMIAADALSYDLVGHLVNGLTGDALNDFLTKLADSPRLLMCTMVAVKAMQDVCAIRTIPLRGSLLLPARENNPERLFCDNELFIPGATMTIFQP